MVCLSKMFRKVTHTSLPPTTSKKGDTKETAGYKWVSVVTQLLNIAVDEFDAKKYALCSQVLVVTKLVISGTRCNLVRVLYDVSVCCSCATVTHCGRSCTRTTSAHTMSGTNCAHWPKRSAGRNSSSPTNCNYK